MTEQKNFKRRVRERARRTGESYTAALRLDCVKRDAGRVWAVREYFLVVDGVGFCLGLGSAVPEEDDELFTEMARAFEVLAGA